MYQCCICVDFLGILFRWNGRFFTPFPALLPGVFRATLAAVGSGSRGLICSAAWIKNLQCLQNFPEALQNFLNALQIFGQCVWGGVCGSGCFCPPCVYACFWSRIVAPCMSAVGIASQEIQLAIGGQTMQEVGIAAMFLGCPSGFGHGCQAG